ncbi:MAG: ferritin family protein [Planctomycetota bacterium]
MEDYQAKAKALSTAKALAIAAYGESVAAFRYRHLAEKTTNEIQRHVFSEMADEEHGHHLAVRALIDRTFPGSDFVLGAADKDLVIVGPRTFDLQTPEAYQSALGMIQESERRTGRFYAELADSVDAADLKAMFREMADECFEHAERLATIPGEFMPKA